MATGTKVEELHNGSKYLLYHLTACDKYSNKETKIYQIDAFLKTKCQFNIQYREITSKHICP